MGKDLYLIIEENGSEKYIYLQCKDNKLIIIDGEYSIRKMPEYFSNIVDIMIVQMKDIKEQDKYREFAEGLQVLGIVAKTVIENCQDIDKTFILKSI